MHLLYESDRKTKIGTLKPTSCNIRKATQGSWYLEMEHKLNGIGAYIERGLYIQAPTPSGPQFFKVKLKNTLNENIIKITAFHIMYNLADEYVKDTNIVNKNRVDACKQILANTLRGHDFTVEGHVGLDKMNNLRIVGYDPFNAIVSKNEDNTVVNRYSNTEWDFDNTKLKIEDVIGEDNGYLFTYNKNMEELNEDEDDTTLITQIVPVTTYDDKRVLLPELTIDSKFINSYNDIVTREIDFTLDINGEEKLSKEQIYTQLREKAKKYFLNTECDIIKVSYNLKNKDISSDLKYKELKMFYDKLNCGDFVYVLKNNGLRLKLRVREYSYDSINKTFESLIINNTFKTSTGNATNTGNKIDSILNQNGSVNASVVQGFIDSTKARIKAAKDSSTKVDVIALDMEVTDNTDPNYGSVLIGTGLGIAVSNERDNNAEWIYESALTAEGLIADKIVGNLLSDKTGSTTLNMNTGEFKSKQKDGSEVVISPTDGFYNKFGDSKREYHHLTYKVDVTAPVNQGELKIQLPSEFKGKYFEVIATLTLVNVDSWNDGDCLRQCGVVVKHDIKTGIIQPASVCSIYNTKNNTTRKAKCWADILVIA